VAAYHAAHELLAEVFSARLVHLEDSSQEKELLLRTGGDCFSLLILPHLLFLNVLALAPPLSAGSSLE
jgi:hypothetical protein